VRDTGRDTVRDTGRDTGRDTVRDTVRDTGRDTVRDTVRDTGRDTVRDTALLLLYLQQQLKLLYQSEREMERVTQIGREGEIRVGEIEG
jgi:hypothetical protein